MPLYEYNCSVCHKDFEFLQKFSDPAMTTCPACGGPLKKRMSLSAFALKGGGWYADGYATPQKTTAEKPAAPGNSTTPSNASGSATSSKDTTKPSSSGSTPATPTTTNS